MKKLFFITVILLFVFIGSSYAITGISDLSLGGHKLKASEKSDGKPLWKSQLRNMKTSDRSGRDMLYIEDVGSGIYGKDKKQQSWRSESFYYIEGNNVTPYHFKQVFKDSSGKVVRTMEKIYDRENGEIICTINNETKKFKCHKDTVDKELLGTVLINYPLNRPNIEFHLLTHEPTMYKINMKYLGNDKVVLDGNTIDCYKLEMIPDLGALNIFGAFVPKTYFWYTLAEPHRFVRYEGLESGLGTPYIVLEAD